VNPVALLGFGFCRAPGVSDCIIVEDRPASGGAELWVLVGERVPDVVVMDLQLPAVDGWELTRQLRADPRTARVPIVVVSASVRDVDRERAFTNGADAFLPKPCSLDEILKTLHRVSKRR
jgi:CheY-like chemotaxis protein